MNSCTCFGTFIENSSATFYHRVRNNVLYGLHILPSLHRNASDRVLIVDAVEKQTLLLYDTSILWVTYQLNVLHHTHPSPLSDIDSITTPHLTSPHFPSATMTGRRVKRRRQGSLLRGSSCSRSPAFSRRPFATVDQLLITCCWPEGTWYLTRVTLYSDAASEPAPPHHMHVNRRDGT